MTTQVPETGEIRPLTTLRALAALLVFLFHYAVMAAPDQGHGVFLRAVWAHGYLGVPMFFVLSGFLLVRLYFDALRDRRVGLRTFLWRRIARIWPLFLALALVQHLAAWALGRQAPDAGWLVTLTMSQGWFAGALYQGLPQAWSLTIEETFYVLVPAICLVIDVAVFGGRRSAELGRAQWGRLLAVLALLVVSAVLLGELAWRVADALGWHWHGFLADRDHMLRMTLAGRLPEFMVGVAAAFVHRDGRLLAGRAGRLAGSTTVLLVAALGVMLALKDSAPSGWQYALHLGVAGATGLLILALCLDHRPARLLGSPPLVYLGRVSYAFYLIQLTVIADVASRVADHAGPARLPVLFALLTAVSAACYEGLEKPARRWLVTRLAGVPARNGS
ncbi:MAG: acyltransferase [Candidatus Krumholzibacteriia bacterium]